MQKPELIIALEKELDTTFAEVPIEEISGWKNKKAAEYVINNAGKIIGLKISDFKLKRLPNGIKAFQDLKTLYLSLNQLTDISALSQLKQLTTLDLSENQLTDISALSQLKQLTTLDLSENQLTDISALSHLKQLTTLNLGWNQLTDISVLSQLKQLTTLGLSRNQLTDISALSHLKQITTLYLIENQLTDISALSHLSKLTHLDLNGNQLTDISALSHVKQLTELDLSNNQLTDISVLSHLKQLKFINLGNTFFKFNFFQIKHGIGDVLTLKNRNQISNISALSSLTKLTALFLQGNKLTDISTLSQLKQITTLYLSHNQLTDISALSQLKQITELDLNSNQLTDIAVLSHLKQLTRLDLNSNQLTDISILSHLKQLKTLDLRDNQLTDISALKDLKQLEQLNLQYNPIQALPEWICDFPNMDILWKGAWRIRKGDITLYDNPLQEPPIEIVKQGKEAIRNYFKKKKEEGTDYLYEAKLILVGEERAGKTTIAKALTQDKAFNINFDEVSTHGIDIIKWMIPKANTNTPKDFRFNIWDFGGQDIYHATHQFFLTKRSFYLFLTEARKDLRFDDFYYWLNIINALGGNSPILAVKNKIDQSSASNDISTYKKLFPQLINDNLIGISCNTAHENWAAEYLPLLNIFKEKMYEVVKNKQIESMGTPLPKTWVQVRKAITKLQDQGKNYITFSDYKAMCKQYNFDQKTISSLSQLFHDLGIFLHFQDNIKLRNTIFINHEYVTKGVYKILDNQTIINSKGEFTEQELIDILQNTPYEHKQAELLNLCEEFKILFKKDKKYLAPQLFEEKKPDIDWDFTDNLHYKYSYGFMPKGIVSYLIVAMHEKIYQHHYWRYGVVFQYKDSYALVEEKRLGKANDINIMIRGAQKNELLNIICDRLHEINSRFTNLEVKEKIGCCCEECVLTQTPYLFSFDKIGRALKKGKRTLECSASFIDVEISEILGFYINTLDKKHISNEELYKLVENGFSGLHQRHDKHDQNFEEIKLQIDQLETDLLANLSEELKAEFESIKSKINTQNKDNGMAIAQELMDSIATLEDKMTHQQVEIFEKLNQSSDNWQAKVKFSIPILKQLGVDIEWEYQLNDIVKGIGTRLKSWMEKLPPLPPQYQSIKAFK